MTENESRPAFLITIDTEGDNLWSRPATITTRNAAFLPRFQALCERYGLLPTYVVNYEMATSPEFVEFGRDVLARQAGEIGMHLHAWNSPPLVPLTADDNRYHPYLIEYPLPVLREKTIVMTRLLEETFGVPMRSHRAGRWAFDERYARVLASLGYTVDCSVTPYISWRNTPGAPDGSGGSDYREFPDRPYWLDLDDISRPGASALLEAPMTVQSPPRPALVRRLSDRLPSSSLPARACDHFWPRTRWLRPKRGNGSELVDIVRQVLDEGRSCAEFMLHSSEFMPGGSPTFRTESDIERLYEDLERLFALVGDRFQGQTLAGFAAGFPRPAAEHV